MHKALFDKKKNHMVMFRHVEFGHGRQGPFLRNDLLLELSKICTVVLTNEYLSSQRFHICGSKSFRVMQIELSVVLTTQ